MVESICGKSLLTFATLYVNNKFVCKMLLALFGCPGLKHALYEERFTAGLFQHGGAHQSCAGQTEGCVEDSAVQR